MSKTKETFGDDIIADPYNTCEVNKIIEKNMSHKSNDIWLENMQEIKDEEKRQEKRSPLELTEDMDTFVFNSITK